MSDYTTTIEVDDEGAGEFLVLKQPFANVNLSAAGIAIDRSEWDALKAAVDAGFASMPEEDSE